MAMRTLTSGTKKAKKIRPVKSSRQVEVKYRRTLLKIVGRIKADIDQLILPVLRQFEDEYTRDANYADVLEDAFERLNNAYIGLNIQAKQISHEYVMGVNQANKTRFYNSLAEGIGINMSTVVGNEGIEGILKGKARENASLITNLKQKYLDDIEVIVWEGTTTKKTAGNLIKDIQEKTGMTKTRAKFIARDQTAKLNAALTEIRQTNLGIKKYQWIASKDKRVRDYHDDLDGLIFDWSDPPITNAQGDRNHPGEDYNCRCTAQAILPADIETEPFKYVEAPDKGTLFR